jgi:hypothetical protein
MQDAEQISSAFVDEANVRKYEEALAIEYKSVLSDLEDFNLQTLTLQDDIFLKQIENEIQKIRAYLVCSEQFESEIIREIYRFVITRLRRGVATRLNILGEFIYQLDQSSRINELLSDLSRALKDVPAEFNFVKLDKLTVEIAVDSEFFDAIAGQLSAIALSYTNLNLLMKNFAD